MPERVAGRMVWAMETLDFGPDDRLLEIGCGAGIAVEMVCERLARGRIHAIDRSEAMAAQARRRNAGHIASGKAVIQAAALHEADFGGARFDRIFAINVGLFREHWVEEAAALRGLLAPGGAICLFHHPPVAGKTRRLAEETAAVLRDEGFAVREIRYDDREAVPMACVIAGGP